MAKLPSDAEMSRLFVLGRTNKEIAEEYDVTPQAVDFRLRKLGLYRQPEVAEANRLIGLAWTLKQQRGAGSHQVMSALQYLRLWLRLQLGDPNLSQRQRENAVNFEARVRRDNVVLDYQPETVKGFFYVARKPEDDGLVIRWPEDRPKPSSKDLDYFRLPITPTDL